MTSYYTIPENSYTAWGGCGGKRKQTNADRIRSMTDEELGKFITGEDLCELLCGSPPACDGCWSCEGKMLAWLKATAEEGET